MTTTITFVVSDQERMTAQVALIELGFEFDEPRATTRTLLDSFDGRLHQAGLRLELVESSRRELVLSGVDVVPVRVAVAATPRLPSDLPVGPLRGRLAALLEVRALLPVLAITVEQTLGHLRDRAEKNVAFAVICERVSILDHGDVGISGATIEIHAALGHDGRAAKVGRALERLGLVGLDGDTLDVAATAAAVELAGVNGSPTVVLEPTMAALDGIRMVLANLADTVAANWQGTIDELDTEFLHDLRVAVRRTRAVLAQGKDVLPPAVVERYREQFAWLGDLTSPARDADVYLLEWDRYTRPLGPDVAGHLEPVLQLLVRRDRTAHQALVAALRSSEARDLVASWRSWLTSPLPDQSGSQAGRPLGGFVRRRIRRAHADLLDHGRAIGSDTAAEQLHDLRKDAKKLRYLLECFGSLLPDAPRKAFVQRLKALQDNLGEHQDTEVQAVELRAIAGELSDGGVAAETMVAIGQLTERLDQRRLAARAEFEQRFEAYDTKATQHALDQALDGLRR